MQSFHAFLVGLIPDVTAQAAAATFGKHEQVKNTSMRGCTALLHSLDIYGNSCI